MDSTLEQRSAITPYLEGPPKPQELAPKPFSAPNVNSADKAGRRNITETSMNASVRNMLINENGKSCQLEFGSYCLWSAEHKEVMKDSMVKKLKDQLFVARSYYPSIVKHDAEESLSLELKQKIQDHEHMLSDAIVDDDLPPTVQNYLLMMDQAIAKAKLFAVDCSNVDKKLRQILALTEGEAHFHMKQSAFMYQLGAQTMPKTHHCLSVRLTVEYFKWPPLDAEDMHSGQGDDPRLMHIVIFSRNILAASVVISSTVANSKGSGNMVFHLLTDVQNFYAMKLWFSRNTFNDSTVHVLNLNKLCHDLSSKACEQFSSSTEFRVSITNHDEISPAQTETHYLSIFGESHFMLPEIFFDLRRVVVLDDDIVVQRDLSPLWDLDLEGKVIGAVESCGVRLRQLRSHLGGIDYDEESCTWMSGLNVVDLENWREHNVSESYHLLSHKLQGGSEGSRKAATALAALLAFQDLIHPLHDSWIVAGLGYNYGVTSDAITSAVALHYNGDMKPWLDLGIPYYRKHWKKYLPEDDHFMHECNLSP